MSVDDVTRGPRMGVESFQKVLDALPEPRIVSVQVNGHPDFSSLNAQLGEGIELVQSPDHLLVLRLENATKERISKMYGADSRKEVARRSVDEALRIARRADIKFESATFYYGDTHGVGAVKVTPHEVSIKHTGAYGGAVKRIYEDITATGVQVEMKVEKSA